MQERSSLIVYFKSPKVMKRIKKIGNITYFNKKRKYAVIYINKADEDSVIKELQSLRHIRKVDDSKLDFTPYSMDNGASLGDDHTPNDDSSQPIESHEEEPQVKPTDDNSKTL